MNMPFNLSPIDLEEDSEDCSILCRLELAEEAA
nr:MAG TPA: hypothetical protein [Caudoviricetes sp.]